MQISAIGTETGFPPTRERHELSSSRRRGPNFQSAFTLVEILVVVAITGIVLAIAAVNFFPSDVQVARREAGNVALALEDARDSAWFGGLPTAITVGEGRIRKWRLAGSEWQPAAGKDGALPADVRITSIHVDGQALAVDERLVFLPDGLGTPFRVALEARGHPWAIEGDASGSVRMVAR